MKLFLKISLVLIILLIIAAIGFSSVFNPNDYKKELITLVKDETGRKLSIPGDISLSFFPWIGIDLGAIKINNAKGFGKQPFAKMSHLQIRIKFLPLFRQKLEADTIVIEGLQLNLAKNKRGVSNWDDFTKTTTKPSKKTPTKTNKQNDNNKNTLAAIALNGIKIKNAQFNWHDQQQKQKVSIKNVQLSIGELKADAKVPFNLQFHLQEKTLDAKIKLKSKIIFASNLKQFSFHNAELATELKLASPKKTLSPQFNSELMQLDLNKQLFTIKKLNLRLDDTNISGNAKIALASDTSTINLSVDNINLDRYLPKPVTEDKKSKPAKNKNTKEAILIPLDLLNALNVNADFEIKKLQIKKTHWKNIHLVMRAKNGKIQIKPLTAQGYAATIKSDFIIKAVKSNALLSGNLDIKNIKAGKLLNDLTGTDKLSGQTTLIASFNTSGLKLSQLKQNLNGKLKLNLKDGTFKGFDLNHQLNVLNAKIEGKASPVAPKPAETKIAKITASAIIKKGILNNKDLRAATPLSRIAGRGTVDIAKEKINYTAAVKFTSATSIKSDVTYEKMNAIPLDIHVGGTFDEPKVNVDFKKLLSQLMKKEIKKEQHKAEKKLKKKLGDKLKNLFKF